MNYKVGDKVKIKTWESMKKEYGIDGIGSIRLPYFPFVKEMERGISKICPDRILTIKSTGYEFAREFYKMQEDDIGWKWSGTAIEHLYKEPVYEPIKSRFDILDL